MVDIADFVGGYCCGRRNNGSWSSHCSFTSKPRGKVAPESPCRRHIVAQGLVQQIALCLVRASWEFPRACRTTSLKPPQPPKVWYYAMLVMFVTVDALRLTGTTHNAFYVHVVPLLVIVVTFGKLPLLCVACVSFAYFLPTHMQSGIIPCFNQLSIFCVFLTSNVRLHHIHDRAVRSWTIIVKVCIWSENTYLFDL